MRPLQGINRQRRARTHGYPAPVLGWNERDLIDQLKETEADRLTNFFPRPNSVELRRGCATFASLASGMVESVLEFSSSGTREMIAFGGVRAVKIVSGGTVTSLSTSMSSARVQGLMANATLCMVNGAQTPMSYDGSTFTTISYTTIPDSSVLIGIARHRSRLYLTEAAKPWFWYSAANAISGALTKFDLTTIGKRGGNCLAVASWSRDAGDGMDDLLVIFMSTGETFVYTGGDPGDATTFSKVGTYYLAPPIDRRAVCALGDDVVFVTRDGLQSLNKALPLGRTSKDAAAISDRISGAFLAAAGSYADNFGWQTIHYPAGSMLIVNVPVQPYSAGRAPTSEQYVMNTATGAWTRWTGLPAVCWGVVFDRLYFGGIEDGAAWDVAQWDLSPWAGGVIARADVGYSDLALDQYGNADATAISWEIKTATFDMGMPGIQKRFLEARPVLEVDGIVNAQVALSPDYQDITPSYALAVDTGNLLSAWDLAQWDVSPWAGGATAVANWFTVEGEGYTASLTIRGQTKGVQVILRRIDFSFVPLTAR